MNVLFPQKSGQTMGKHLTIYYRLIYIAKNTDLVVDGTHHVLGSSRQILFQIKVMKFFESMCSKTSHKK